MILCRLVLLCASNFTLNFLNPLEYSHLNLIYFDFFLEGISWLSLLFEKVR